MARLELYVRPSTTCLDFATRHILVYIRKKTLATNSALLNYYSQLHSKARNPLCNIYTIEISWLPSDKNTLTMRSLLIFAAAAPALVLAAPEVPPKITSLKFSGSGCPNNSGSVKSTSGVLGDSATFTFGQLRGDNTDNCEIHIQSTGASQGWQAAVKEVEYQGNVALAPSSQLDTITQTFWSDHAADTVSSCLCRVDKSLLTTLQSTLKASIPCTGPAIKDAVTIKSSTNDLTWSKCTGADGNPGILNVNFRPVVQGASGTYDFKQASWGLVWRKC